MNEELRLLLDDLVELGLENRPPTREQARAILRSEDNDLLDVVAAASKIRRHYFSNRVKLNFLVNMKSGLCPEDCSYCSQQRGAKSDVLKYNWIDPETAADATDRAAQGGAKRVCLVASGRGPSDKDLERVSKTVETIKERHPEMEVCVCVGILQEGQAERLKESGAFAYNHNLNTSEERYSQICSTHTFADRVDTVQKATSGGLSPCSGAIFGMGESDEDIVELAFRLRDLSPDSVPLNFLIPFQGTPMEGKWELTPQRCLRIASLFRFVFPSTEVRLAGGRELHLRSLQALGLHVANSIFLGDYLTSEGQAANADLQMISDGGFVVEGSESTETNAAHLDLVAVRRRGLGTQHPVNA